MRLKEGDRTEYYIVTTPKKSKSSNKIDGTVDCVLLAEILKTKNIYLVFDEENGIGTMPYLMEQILAGTGWSFDSERSDVFYENWGVDESAEKVEKKRSLSVDSKSGSYELITKVCDLFKAYPVFDTENKKVICYALENKRPLWEMEVGRNLTALTKQMDSSSIVTRLYVEGDYDEEAYVGIDDVNPTGLNFLLSFDYYKEIGLFTEEHQAALNKYLEDIQRIKRQSLQTSAALIEKESNLALLWGSVNYVLRVVKNGALAETYVGGTVTEKQKEFVIGDTVYWFTDDGKYTVEKITKDTLTNLASNIIYALKFVNTSCNGSIGAKEISIEAKEQTIAALEKENEKTTTDEDEKKRNEEEIARLKEAIEKAKTGDEKGENQTYTIKITGEEALYGGKAITATIKRESVSAVLNRMTYKLKDTNGELSSDESVTILEEGVSLTFGRYAKSGALPYQSNVQKLEGLSTEILTDELIDVSSVEREIEITSNAAVGVHAAVFTGTTFTLTAHMVAYGLYEQFAMAVRIAEEVGKLEIEQTKNDAEQKNIEADFAVAMGDMLRDGYWSDENYIKGQERYLYNDALLVMDEISKPTAKYTVSLAGLSDAMAIPPDQMEVNAKIRLYDKELDLNDTLYVSKISYYIDQNGKGSVEITNEEVNISASFDSIFNRITTIADLIQQKQSIFDRAKALTSAGSLKTDRLNGAIDIMMTKLMSSTSNWYTDDNGNIIFETADGKSAMRLCGDGFMIADGKKDDGSWNWRTCSTGKGIVADTITTGYLSADVIEARSITANKLASDVGESLDLSSNQSVTQRVEDQIADAYTQIKTTKEAIMQEVNGA